ncbi:ABC transporter ATP-binding protein [Halomonas sp. 18H]|uniref:ABC transporter ATP-binding protein n=1 Tax=Halomonas almeriensis TaxID=308163 RepID=UPI00222E8B50|nr:MULTISPECIES: ABC transporter ATP-binding protein [Halomonas]MCW4152925.1 ABC transporter ATP-binding protein [Halomonas sp. 18H]MDN3554252.1 ABC transporter ATP-binding protein [Halomonas almeriensis]
MIEIRNLYKRYHNHHGSPWVLKDINLSFPPGVSVGLVGRNGAGKSTLLRLIAGMDHPEKGSIERGCRVSWPIGLAGGFQGSMTGRQNVKFVARVHGGRNKEQEIIDRVQSFAEIGDAFDEPINTYSSGMRARLNFGLSLAFDFDVYLSDEATSVGDRSFKAKATKAFKDKVGQASLIMVSHGESILKDLCQAGVYLHDGQATWYDDVEGAIEAYHADTDGNVEDHPLGAPVRPQRLVEPGSLAQAREQLRQRRTELDNAKAMFADAKEQALKPNQRKHYEDALREAKQNAQDAKARFEAFKKDSNEGAL